MPPTRPWPFSPLGSPSLLFGVQSTAPSPSQRVGKGTLPSSSLAYFHPKTLKNVSWLSEVLCCGLWLCYKHRRRPIVGGEGTETRGLSWGTYQGLTLANDSVGNSPEFRISGRKLVSGWSWLEIRELRPGLGVFFFFLSLSRSLFFLLFLSFFFFFLEGKGEGAQKGNWLVNEKNDTNKDTKGPLSDFQDLPSLDNGLLNKNIVVYFRS